VRGKAWKQAKKSYWKSLLLFLGASLSSPLQATTVFYYGIQPPIEKLSLFNRAVVEAENVTVSERKALIRSGVEMFAYVSLGEVNRTRAWFSEIKESWKLGRNTAWNSVVVDLDNPEWHRYLLEKRLLPLWNRGYHGFFLDTLDSYMRVVSVRDKQQQQRGLVELISAIHARFPGVKLILNRGFEIMPEVFQYADGVVAESLYQRWDAIQAEYVEVPQEDRNWLLSQLNRVVEDYHLPVTVIDYLPNEAARLTQKIAHKIQHLGFSPWISVPSLDSISVGMLNFLDDIKREH